METGKISAEYHLYKRELDAAKARIAELELALQKQAKAALHGMDAAKASGTAMIKAATEMQSQLKPELIESERQANAVLTQENEKLHQQIEQLREALIKSVRYSTPDEFIA